MHISVSILACNLLKLEQALNSICNADSIHFDVMDGHYVDEISFGCNLCETIHNCSSLPIHAHLMISNPDLRVLDYIEAGAKRIIIHPETCSDINKIYDSVKRHGGQLACAIYSKYDMDIALKMLNLFDSFVFMTVQPGRSFQKISYSRLEELNDFSSRILGNDNCSKEIFVDGGVNDKTINQCLLAGANAIISGGYIFKSCNPNSAIKSLRECVCF